MDVLGGADLVARVRMENNRMAASPIEGHGILARPLVENAGESDGGERLGAGEVVGLDVGVIGQLETGTVWVNEFLHLSPLAPFGGHKQSGFGAEYGVEGLKEFTYTQVITVKKDAFA